MLPTHMAKSSKVILLFFLTLVTLAMKCCGDMTCKKVDSCSCAYSEDLLIDLSPLSANPKWFDQYDPDKVNMYSYNPCHAFTESSCKDVAMCQNTGSGFYYALGTQTSANFSNDPQTGQLSVQYASVDSIGVTRTSRIFLTCAESGEDVFGVLGETSPGSANYLFTLSSVHCCPKSGGNGTGSSRVLSLGSYIAIGFVSAVLLYLALGMAIQKFARRKTGRDVIPNYKTWTNVTSLVKDGVCFALACRLVANGNYEAVK